MKEQIISKLAPGHPWGELLQYFDCVDSTNTLAKKLAFQGAPHGTVVIAGRQTGGRGRMGRSFHSPAGTGLYFSVILRPRCAPKQLMHLTCATAVALCNAVQTVTGLTPGIKWINDLVCNGQKIAGILTEMALQPTTGQVDYAVIGIGVNCRQRREDFPPELQQIAASLSMISHQDIFPADIAAALIEELYRMDNALLSGKAAIMNCYRQMCVTLGQEVSLHGAGTVRHGWAIGLDDDGGLIVAFPDGSTEIVNSGEASVRGIYGYV